MRRKLLFFMFFMACTAVLVASQKRDNKQQLAKEKLEQGFWEKFYREPDFFFDSAGQKHYEEPVCKDPEPLWDGTGVLVGFQENSVEKVLLSREAVGSCAGRYDLFGGRRVEGETLLQTAMRKLCEGTILKGIVQMQNSFPTEPTEQEEVFSSLRYEIKSRLESDKTHKIFATHIKSAEDGEPIAPLMIFIVMLRSALVNMIRDNFVKARAQQTQLRFCQKDALAVVDWETFKKAVAGGSNVVKALVADSSSPTPYEQAITLHSRLMVTLSGFCAGKPGNTFFIPGLCEYDCGGQTITRFHCL